MTVNAEISLQKILQAAVTLGLAVVIHHDFDGARIADQNQGFLCSCDRRVKKIAVIELRRTGKHRDHDAVELISLTLMHSNSVGKVQLRGVLKADRGALVNKIDPQPLAFAVYRFDDADVAVENAFADFSVRSLPADIVVVFDLHDLVAHAECA